MPQNPNIELIISRIKFLSKEKKISMRKLAEMIGMSSTGLHRSLANGSIKLETILKISDALDVTIDSLFDVFTIGEGHKSTMEISAMLIGTLKIALEEKNQEIDKLISYIQKLEKSQKTK